MERAKFIRSVAVHVRTEYSRKLAEGKKTIPKDFLRLIMQVTNFWVHRQLRVIAGESRHFTLQSIMCAISVSIKTTSIGYDDGDATITSLGFRVQGLGFRV